MNAAAQPNGPLFNTPSRWALRVLSWLAFGLAAYLAWFAVNQTSVAGCGVGSHNGCDAVLNSAWSKWLSVPVAVLGLACYATLAALSVMLGIRSNASRWILTAFMAFAFLAIGASLWFIGIQVIAIGEFCRYCMVIDLCGIAIGVITAWAAIRSWRGLKQRSASVSSGTFSALRGAMPSSARLAPVAATRASTSAGSSAAVPAAPRTAPTSASRSVPLVGSVASPTAAFRRALPPSVGIAFSGALAMLAVLIGGQIVFPAKMFDMKQVALNDAIELSGSGGGQDDPEASDAAQTRVALRIPAEGTSDDDTKIATDSTAEASKQSENSQGNGEKGAMETDKSASNESPSAPSQPKRERKVQFLGGKLTLDTYSQPIIGSPQAPHVVVEMVSYDCTHCRKTNKFMKQALSRYGDQVALIVLVLPLDRACNKLITDPAGSHAGACTTARTALAIAKLRPSSFPRFHEYLMTGKDKPPARESIIAKAYSMVDRTKLKEVRDSDEVAKQIAGYVELFATLGKQHGGGKAFGLPIQILGDEVMTGSVENADDIYKAWEKNLGVKPR